MINSNVPHSTSDFFSFHLLRAIINSMCSTLELRLPLEWRQVISRFWPSKCCVSLRMWFVSSHWGAVGVKSVFCLIALHYNRVISGYLTIVQCWGFMTVWKDFPGRYRSKGLVRILLHSFLLHVWWMSSIFLCNWVLSLTASTRKSAFMTHYCCATFSQSAFRTCVSTSLMSHWEQHIIACSCFEANHA